MTPMTDTLTWSPPLLSIGMTSNLLLTSRLQQRRWSNSADVIKASNKAITRDGNLIKSKARKGLIGSDETFKAFPEVRTWSGDALLLPWRSKWTWVLQLQGKCLCQQLSLEDDSKPPKRPHAWLTAGLQPCARLSREPSWAVPGLLTQEHCEIIIYRNKTNMPSTIISCNNYSSFLLSRAHHMPVPVLCLYQSSLSFHADTIKSLKIYSLF